jgi:hypothetical protein
MQGKEFFNPSDPTASPQRRWFVATGQEMKLRIPMILVFMGAGLWAVGKLDNLLGLPLYAAEVLTALGSIIILGSLLYPLVAISCPHCKCRVLAHFMRHSHVNSWLRDFEDATQCPRCGHVPRDLENPGATGARQVG